ncbi:MAG: tetratricopeptide repeat protein [Desulfobulbaceae bacterium]|nr:MAG: tetratricopeptide repeat protein [Desulfobulbaceae bacterium]
MNTNDSLSPEFIEKVYTTACELHQKGQYAEAHNHYTHLLEIFPESSSLHYNIGLLFYEQGKYAESLEHYLRALDTTEDDIDLLYNLGLCLKKCGQISEAILVYAALTEKNPDDADCLYNLACCYKDIHEHTQAIEVLRQVLYLQPKHQSATNNLAYLLHLQGNLHEAKRYYEILLELNPDHQAARHMLASVQGETVSNAPEEYIRSVFNSYAATFDDNLVQSLSYSVPEQLRRGIDSVRGDRASFNHALDLGCGTGLSGLVLSDICYHLTGVDISEDMLEKAREKQVYDTLVVDEILRFLLSADTSYDLVMLADVLIYIGDIEPVLAALQMKTTEDVLLCFSTERDDEADFQLQPTGRFAHSPKYVSSTAERTGWAIAYSEETTLRKEGSDWVEGTLFYLVKDKFCGSSSHE